MNTRLHKAARKSIAEEEQREIERSQRLLGSVLQFDPEAKICAVCGVLIYSADTLPCRDAPGCEAKMGEPT